VIKRSLMTRRRPALHFSKRNRLVLVRAKRRLIKAELVRQRLRFGYRRPARRDIMLASEGDTELSTAVPAGIENASEKARKQARGLSSQLNRRVA
jgi:hypothetical protein